MEILVKSQRRRIMQRLAIWCTGFVLALLPGLEAQTSGADIGEVPAMEKKLVEEVIRNGPGDRLVIAEFRPGMKDPPMSATVEAGKDSSYVILRLEFPRDAAMVTSGVPPDGLGLTISPSGEIGFRGFMVHSTEQRSERGNSASVPASGLLQLLLAPARRTAPQTPTIGTAGSVHRFFGTVEVAGYRFVGEGDKSERLTFGLIDGVGYVYLRGRGKVVMKRMFTPWAEGFTDRKALISNGVFVARAAFCA